MRGRSSDRAPAAQHGGHAGREWRGETCLRALRGVVVCEGCDVAVLCEGNGMGCWALGGAVRIAEVDGR